MLFIIITSSLIYHIPADRWKLKDRDRYFMASRVELIVSELNETPDRKWNFCQLNKDSL